MYGLATQLALLIISGVIIVTFIQPTFDSIAETQDQIYEFEAAVDNATEFNRLLGDLVAQVQALPTSDQQALEKYMPDVIDEAQVLSDISNIAGLNDVVLVSAAGSGLPQLINVDQSRRAVAPTDALEGRSVQSELYAQEFNLQLIGTYSGMQDFLRAIEQNAYPLDVLSLSFSADDQGDIYTFNLSVRTYALGATQLSANDIAL